MFVTLTFPRDDAPDEDTAHKALRSLVARLRYRAQLGAYSWVLERQSNGDPDGETERERLGSLHYHGIWQMPWQDDDLEQWRSLITESGFGPRNRLTVASRRNAYYCTKYIAKGPADLAPLRRAYGFSRNFPRTAYDQERALSVIRRTPGTRERRNPLADPPSTPLIDPGDQMRVFEFEELEAHMAEVLGIERDLDGCEWVLTGRRSL
jgi:hypothetical protein